MKSSPAALAVLVSLGQVQPTKVVLGRALPVVASVRHRPGAQRGGRVGDSQQSRLPGKRAAGRDQLAARALPARLGRPAAHGPPDLVPGIGRVPSLSLRRAARRAERCPPGPGPRGRHPERRRVAGDRDLHRVAPGGIRLPEPDEPQLARAAVHGLVPASLRVKLPGPPVVALLRAVQLRGDRVLSPADRAGVQRRLARQAELFDGLVPGQAVQLDAVQRAIDVATSSITAATEATARTDT